MIGLIKKTFGGGKEFYLEADESQEAATELEVAPAVVEKKEAEPEPASETEATPEAVSEEAEAPVKAKKTKKKKEEVVTEAPKPAAAASPDLIVAAVNGTKSKAEAVAANSVEPFAPNSLLPIPTSRRRPGPSLNSFRNMARQLGR